MSAHTVSSIVTAIIAGDSFQSVLRLKSGWNRILAADAHVHATSGLLVVQTLDSGILSCQLDLEKIRHASTE